MEELDFETAYTRLEETVRRLEAGGLSLEEAVALYEEGVRLAEYCNQRLDAADLRVQKLTLRDNPDVQAESVIVELTPLEINLSDRNLND